MTQFSIILPTRNRAALLGGSIRSALAQTLPDFELIVSDNNSRDNTAQVVREHAAGTTRIRYINPGRDLSMNAHWEFALGHAQGDYVVFLADDDALVPEALRVAASIIAKTGSRCVTWGRSMYTHPDVPEQHLRGSFGCPTMTGTVVEVACRDLANSFWDLCGGGLFNVAPKALNCALERSFIGQCSARFGRFFAPPFPDASTTCHVVGGLPSYTYVDAPLYVCGISVASNAGIKYDRKKKIDDYLSLFDEDILARAPHSLKYFGASYFLATFLRFQGQYPLVFTGQPDMATFFKRCALDLVDAGQWDDVAAERALLHDVARNMLGASEARRVLEEGGPRQPSLAASLTLRAARRARGVLGRGKRAVLGGVAASRPMGATSIQLPVAMRGVVDSFAAAQLTGGLACDAILRAASQRPRPPASRDELLSFNR